MGFLFNPGFLIFLILINHFSLTSAITTKTDETANPPPPPQPVRSRITPFKPSIAIIVGTLTTIFSITFLLLLYLKHCKRETYISNSRLGHTVSRGNSGINRKVIESLPLFRFSSLRGQKDGLECAVCLNKFDPNEVLRLLPKCKHAFHVECVETWLDAHSTCPLCRYRVDPEDILLMDQITPRNSDHVNPRMSGRHSSAGEKLSCCLEITVENRGARDYSRGRVSLDSWNNSRREKTGNFGNQWPDLMSKSRNSALSENPGRLKTAARKDGQLPVQGDGHRLEHRIVVSREVEEEGWRRWSDVQAVEMLYLRSEMILGGEREGSGSGRGVINGRSVSEITGVSRCRSNNIGEREEREREEERVVKRWLDWISKSQQKPAVNSASSSSSSSSSAIVVV